MEEPADTNIVSIEPTAALRKKCFEQGQDDFSLGKSCNENPYKRPFEREEWFRGFMHQKKIVYRERAKTK